MTSQALVLSVITAVLWAAAPILVDRGLSFSKCGYNEINPIRSLTFFLLTMFIICVEKGGFPSFNISLKVFSYVFLSVFLGYTIGDILYFMAIREIGLGLAVPITNAYPLITVFTTWVILKEPITISLLVGVLLVFAGLTCINVGRRGVEDSGSSVIKIKCYKRGFTLAVAAGTVWALAVSMIKCAMVEGFFSPLELTMWRSIMLLALSWSVRIVSIKFLKLPYVPLKRIEKSGWIYISAASIVGLCAGSILYSTSLQYLSAAVVTAVTATSPFMVAVFCAVFYKKRLHRVQWTGIVLVITGSVIVSL